MKFKPEDIAYDLVTDFMHRTNFYSGIKIEERGTQYLFSATAKYA